MPNEIISIHDLGTTEKNLIEISEKCKEQIKAAQAMACTEETKKAVKNTRAELNKQFSEYEAERKNRTAEYEKPLKEFKAMYDKYIANPFKEADKALKQKIDDVENQQKSDKKETLVAYAEELKAAYALNWLDINRVLPNITLSASLASLKSTVSEKLGKIKEDTECIETMSDGAELFSEYMKTLNLAQAKLIVVERKHAVEAAEKAQAAQRKREEIKQEAEEKVEAFAPPVIEEPPQEVKKYQMTFTVTGTLEQLKALKFYMIENNIEILGGK